MAKMTGVAVPMTVIRSALARCKRRHKANSSYELMGQQYHVAERYLLRDSSLDGRPWVCPKWKSSAGGTYTACKAFVVCCFRD